MDDDGEVNQHYEKPKRLIPIEDLHEYVVKWIRDMGKGEAVVYEALVEHMTSEFALTDYNTSSRSCLLTGVNW